MEAQPVLSRAPATWKCMLARRLKRWVAAWSDGLRQTGGGGEDLDELH